MVLEATGISKIAWKIRKEWPESPAAEKSVKETKKNMVRQYNIDSDVTKVKQGRYSGVNPGEHQRLGRQKKRNHTRG